MEADATFIRANRAVHLHAIAAVDLNLSLVVNPGHAEHDDTLWLDHSLQNFCLTIDGVGLDDRHHRLGHFLNGLMKLRFGGIFGDDVGHEFLHCLAHNDDSSSRALIAALALSGCDEKILAVY